MLGKEKAKQIIDLDYLNLDFCLTGQEAAACYNEHVTDVTFNERKRKVSWNHQDGNYICPKKSCKPSKNGTRESPLYVKCILTDPHGLKLCSLDRKKADWYIAKGKGKVCLDCTVFSKLLAGKIMMSRFTLR